MTGSFDWTLVGEATAVWAVVCVGAAATVIGVHLLLERFRRR